MAVLSQTDGYTALTPLLNPGNLLPTIESSESSLLSQAADKNAEPAWTGSNTAGAWKAVVQHVISFFHLSIGGGGAGLSLAVAGRDGAGLSSSFHQSKL